MSVKQPPPTPEVVTGLMFALAAFTIWGMFPLYWKQLAHVPVLEVLTHRILWTVPVAALAVTYVGSWGQVMRLLRTPEQIFGLLITTLLISTNWFVFVWAVNHQQVLEASLGYYLMPLLSALLGGILFQERLRLWQWVAVSCAVAGVGVQVVALGYLPWVALVLGASFAGYGAGRKRLQADPMSGLFIETLLLAPFALGALLFWEWQNSAAFLRVTWSTDLLLIVGGIVTATPLLFHTGAARRLRLITLGLLFYLTPTLQFFLGVFLYHEPVHTAQLISFVLIWFGLGIYTAENWRVMRWGKRE